MNSGQWLFLVWSVHGHILKYVCDLLSWACLLNFCFFFSSVTEGCKGTVFVWPHLPPPQLAGERLFWHQICGSRQAAGKSLCVLQVSWTGFIQLHLVTIPCWQRKPPWLYRNLLYGCVLSKRLHSFLCIQSIVLASSWPWGTVVWHKEWGLQGIRLQNTTFQVVGLIVGFLHRVY